MKLNFLVFTLVVSLLLQSNLLAFAQGENFNIDSIEFDEHDEPDRPAQPVQPQIKKTSPEVSANQPVEIQNSPPQEIPETQKPEPQIVSKPQGQTIQEDSNNSLGLIYAANHLEKANSLTQQGKLAEAEAQLKEASDWLTSATEYHFELFKAFSKYTKTMPLSKIEKAYAHDFAKLRDKSYLLLANNYIAQKKYRDATPVLVEIIKSQPDSDIGLKAYSTLQQIKFAD